MMNMFFELSMLTFEAQQAMWLRALKLSTGGPASDREVQLMVSEKVAAAQQAATKLVLGAAPITIVRGYRRKVQANVRRLSKRPAKSRRR